MNSISRMPPGPSFTSSASSRRSTSRSISAFISAQALEDAVIQIAPIDKWSYGGCVHLRIPLRRCDGARLDPRIAFPVAAVTLQVILERGEARDERAARAERSQPHVDAENRPLVSRRLEQPDERLSETGEELLVGDRARAVGLPVLWKQQHQIDVRGEIEFAPPRSSMATTTNGCTRPALERGSP